MNVYQAVLAAADHIERNPRLFYFMNNKVPDCRTPGCLFGWVGHFMGLPANTDCWDGVAHHFGLTDNVEGARWVALGDLVTREMGFDEFLRYQTEPATAAKFLRHYAAKYLAPPAPVQTFDFQALAERLAREPLVVNRCGQTLGVSAQ